jgi:phasin family protein
MLRRTNWCAAPYQELTMTLQERLFEISARLRDQADAYAQRAATATRHGIDRAAQQVEALDTPLDALAVAGLQLNQISAKYVARLVTQQTAASRALVRDGAAGLRSLAEADSLPQALQQQLARLADRREQAVDNLRRSWELTAEAGREVAELATSTYRSLARPGKTARRARRPRAAQGGTPSHKGSSTRRAGAARRPATAARPRKSARPAAPTA